MSMRMKNWSMAVRPAIGIAGHQLSAAYVTLTP